MQKDVNPAKASVREIIYGSEKAQEKEAERFSGSEAYNNGDTRADRIRGQAGGDNGKTSLCHE